MDHNDERDFAEERANEAHLRAEQAAELAAEELRGFTTHRVRLQLHNDRTLYRAWRRELPGVDDHTEGEHLRQLWEEHDLEPVNVDLVDWDQLAKECLEDDLDATVTDPELFRPEEAERAHAKFAAAPGYQEVDTEGTSYRSRWVGPLGYEWTVELDGTTTGEGPSYYESGISVDDLDEVLDIPSVEEADLAQTFSDLEADVYVEAEAEVLGAIADDLALALDLIRSRCEGDEPDEEVDAALHRLGEVVDSVLDRSSSASRQHWIETGRYLRKGEAETASA